MEIRGRQKRVADFCVERKGNMAKRNSAHAQKRRAAAKPFSFREMTAKQKRIAALIVSVCVVVLAAIVLLCADVLPHRDGSLNVRGGKAQTTRENALVINGGSQAEPKYFEIATVSGTMDGFTLTEYTVDKGDENITQFWYEADDAENEIYHYYLCGIPMRAEKTMRASAMARGLISSEAAEDAAIPGEVRGTYDDGRAYCGYALLQQDAENDGGMWHRYLFLYTDAGENACVLMQVDSRAKTEAGLATEEALLAFAREAWKNVELLK